MPITENELKELITKSFPEAKVECVDLAGDDDHWEVRICDSSFKGQSRIAQHKMVQAAVKGHDIHALSIKTSAQ